MTQYLYDAPMAVRGFFIISGFLIIRSYWTSKTTIDYIIKRLKRLVPAYLLVIVFSAIGLALLSNLKNKDYFTSPIFIKYIIANVCFMNFLQPTLPGVFDENYYMEVNGSLWTIKIELGFYILIPLIAKLLYKCRTKTRINIVLLMLYISSYVYRFFCSHLLTDVRLAEMLSRQLPGCLQYFIVGIFCAVNYQFIHKYDKYLIIPAIILVILHYIIGTDYLLPIGLAVIVFFVGFHFSKLNSIGKTSDYSYGIYLFHFPIIQMLVSLGYFAINKYMAILITICIVFSISYLSWNCFEKRILKRL
jgi:peptidoglycan/LPS O-acetylase OafA/YrhL